LLSQVQEIIPLVRIQPLDAGYPAILVSDRRCTVGGQAGIRFYKLDKKTFTFSVRKGFFRTPGLPARVEAQLPSACVVAALAGVLAP
jgi:hypothetical protein